MIRLVALLVVVFCFETACSSEFIKMPLQEFQSYYMAEMKMGTPASTVHMALSIFPYPFILQCAKQSDEQLYVPEESSSMSKVYCNSTSFECDNKCPLSNKKEQCYTVAGKDKTKIKVYEDVLQLSQNEKTKAIFNCQDFQNKNDGKQKKQKQSTGFLSISSLERTNPLASWLFASDKREKVLSFCFGQTGYVQLGVDPQNKPSKGLSLTYAKNKNAFVFRLSKISLGSTTIFDDEESKPMNIIFGSLNNYISLVPNKIYNKINQIVSKICEKDEECQFAKQKGVMTYPNIENIQQLQKKFTKEYPILSFQINGQTLKMQPIFYLCAYEKYFAICFKGIDQSIVLLAQKFLLFRKITVFLEQHRLEISDLQACSGDGESDNSRDGQSSGSQASGKSGKEDFSSKYQYKRDKNSQKDDSKAGMRDERPKQQHPREEEADNQKQEKKDELSEQKQPKETTKGTFDSNQFKLLLFLVIIFLLILIFCGGKIHRFCLGQKNKLNTTSSELTEEVGHASEMSVK